MNANPSANPPRRHWFRFLYQFSLRTMLVGMTLAAVACWWFLRPPVQEEELAGRYLKLRRQVRLAPVDDGSVALTGVQADVTAITSVGWWQLRDENDDLLVDGRYDSDLPQGRWTLWHANGRKAAEGEAFRGGRTGVWRVWDERGTMRSEVTYRAVTPTPPGLQPPRTTPIGYSFIPGVGMIGPMGQLAPPYNPTPMPPPVRDRYLSQRHGPCRVWYASGQLQLEGQYADDQRDGLWTFYDEQGGVTEKGAYKAGLRDGEWRIAGTKPGPGVPEAESTGAAPGAGLLPAKVTFVAGRTQADHNALLARLAADLASGSLRRQLAAVTQLEQLGPAGVPILTAAIEGNNSSGQILALRTLMRLEALSPELLPAIEPLVGDDNERLALRAMLAVYQLAPQRRSQLHPRIMALVERSPSEELACDALIHICNLDPDRRLLVFMALAERLAADIPTMPPVQFLDHISSAAAPDLRPIQRLETDPVPLLAAAFGHRDARVRIYVLVALKEAIESDPALEPSTPTGSAYLTWPVPPAVQTVLDRAKADPDPRVRAQAEEVGRQQFTW